LLGVRGEEASTIQVCMSHTPYMLAQLEDMFYPKRVAERKNRNYKTEARDRASRMENNFSFLP
jgi:hypothetical protein